MKEFVDKLIEKLNEGSFAVKSSDNECGHFSFINLERAIGIVNQLAEEYNPSKSSSLENGWIPCEERYPDTTDYILLSFSNFSIPVVGRWEEDKEGGEFYVGDEMESCVSLEMFVNAWQQLPKAYRPGEEKDSAKNAQTRIERIRSMSVEEMEDKLMESGIDTMLDFCQNFCGECEKIPESECRKCLIKWLKSPVERKKTIPTEHFQERFNRVI